MGAVGVVVAVVTVVAVVAVVAVVTVSFEFVYTSHSVAECTLYTSSTSEKRQVFENKRCRLDKDNGILIFRS